NPGVINGGAITRNTGIALDNQTSGASNTNLLIGTNNIPSGNYSIYNSSSYQNYFGGATNIQTSTTNSTTGFQVQNAAGTQLINVDTTNPTNLITNGSFEVNTTGWAAEGSSTISQSAALQYIGNDSLSIVTTAAANDGAKFAYALASNTKYTLNYYVRTNLTS